jgi:hypothetical protein
MSLKRLFVFAVAFMLAVIPAQANKIEDRYEAERDKLFEFKSEAEGRKFVEEHSSWRAPDGFAIPYTICSDENPACVYDQVTLTLDAPFAYRGVYQAERNLAYCLSTGCDGAVQPNPILGCAWRIVITSSGSPKVDQTDTDNLETECGRLSSVERDAAQSQATQLSKHVD